MLLALEENLKIKINVCDHRQSDLCAECRAGGPCVLSETAVWNVQSLAQCSEEAGTKVLHLLIFLSDFCGLFNPLSK